PYGHRAPEGGLLSLLGFNGERPDPVTGHYVLGNGYRAFNPVLMRFNSPDSLSPFEEGGLNAYAYCVGDPINRVDPTGHVGNLFKGILNLLKLRTPSTKILRPANSLPSINPNITPQAAPSSQTISQRSIARHSNQRDLSWDSWNIPLTENHKSLSIKAPKRVAQYISKHRSQNLN